VNDRFFLPQPLGVPWPTNSWPRSIVGADVDSSAIGEVVDKLFSHGVNPPSGSGVSLALLVVKSGSILVEQYGTIPGGVFAPESVVDADTSLISWSMAKSMTHALTGLMVDDGLIDIESPVGVAEWSNDARAEITIRHLLQMRDGLDFIEDYVVDAEGNSSSDVIAMLFGEGSADVAAYARSRPAKYKPGEMWSYSSGTTNILTALLGQVVGGAEFFMQLMNERLFNVLGMTTAQPTFDSAGTFIGSSYVHATAQDFARFGYLYLRGGLWDDKRVLSERWVESARDQHAVDPESGHGYGSHWWTWKSRPNTLAALGYEGQRTIVDYGRDLVVVHLGKWPAETQLELDRALTQVIEGFPLVRE